MRYVVGEYLFIRSAQRISPVRAFKRNPSDGNAQLRPSRRRVKDQPSENDEVDIVQQILKMVNSAC